MWQNFIRQVKRIKEEKEKAMEDKENVQNKCEKQMNELCATLEKYKVDILYRDFFPLLRPIVWYSLLTQLACKDICNFMKMITHN